MYKNICGDMFISVSFYSFFVCVSFASSEGIYPVGRQDFAPSQPAQPVARSLPYQNLVNGRNGVYKVSRQDFGRGNAPFSQNGVPQPGYGYDVYYSPEQVRYPYEYGGGGYFHAPPPATNAPLLPPRLFVPAESPSYDQIVQPNYQNVLSLSEYNRRFYKPSPSLPPPPPSPPSLPASHWQLVAVTSPPWIVRVPPSLPADTPAPPLRFSTAARSPVVPASSTTSSPAPSTVRPSFEQSPTEAYLEDGVLPPISSNSDENQPLPAVSSIQQTPLPPPPRSSSVSGGGEDNAAVNERTGVKYHSFNEFVEVSDEHRELLESFGPIQNNDSDFSELPQETSPIRRRRRRITAGGNASRGVRNTYAIAVRASSWDDDADGGVDQNSHRGDDAQQMMEARVNRLWQQLRMLSELKRAATHEAEYRCGPRLPAGTVVASDGATVVVFDDGGAAAGFEGQQRISETRATISSGEVEPLVVKVRRHPRTERTRKGDGADFSSSPATTLSPVFGRGGFLAAAGNEQSDRKGSPAVDLVETTIRAEASFTDFKTPSFSVENSSVKPDDEFPSSQKIALDSTVSDSAAFSRRNSGEYIIYVNDEDAVKVATPVTENSDESLFIA